MTDSLNDRIRQARHHAGFTPKELADKVCMSKKEGHKLEAGRSQLPRKIVAIASFCGVDPVWLDSGYGEMVPPATRG